MAQLGSGTGSSFPNEVDARQTFINSPVASPDGPSRIDSEVINDSLHAIVQVETTLGAKPNGDFASVAARLQQFIPGGGTSPVYFSFVAATSVTIPGTMHHLGTANPLVQVYDNATPRHAIEPNTATVNPTTYDVVLTFAVAQSGVVCLANPIPQYTATFTSQTTVTVSGLAHGLGTPLLLVNVYTVVGGLYVLVDTTTTIHPTTFDVVVTFATPQTGGIAISAAGPRYSTTFTSQTSVTILGAAHGLDTASLLFQLYNASTPRLLIQPNTWSVDPATFNVVFTFLTPQSGSVLVVSAIAIGGQDFQITDRGIADSTAVRVYSEAGQLHLQMGSGNFVVVENPTGTITHAFSTFGDLEISGNALKPGGGVWLTPSDQRLKTVLRPFADGLELLLQMNPVWFVYNGLGGVRPDGREQVSLIAQDAQAIAAYLVGTVPGQLEPGGPATEFLTLDTGPILYMLLNAVKALYQTQQAQEARLALLEAAVFPPEEPSL